MGIINKGVFGKALWEGVNAWYGEAYNEFPLEYTELFNKYNSNKASEEDVGLVGLGLAGVMTDGGDVSFDAMRQGYITRYKHIKYGLGFIITDEMIEDDLYGVAAQKSASSIGYSMRQTKETIAANVYNRAFNSTYTGGDGIEMISAVHPNVSGGTWSNTLATAADLSEASLEQACIDMGSWTNDRGLQINAMPQKLVISIQQQFLAERILMSPLRVGTADNDVNALKNMGKFPGGVVMNHYLTDADAWFLRTDIPDGMKYFERRADALSDDIDFNSDNIKYKTTARYSFGWTDARGIYGSPGI